MEDKTIGGTFGKVNNILSDIKLKEMEENDTLNFLDLKIYGRNNRFKVFATGSPHILNNIFTQSWGIVRYKICNIWSNVFFRALNVCANQQPTDRNGPLVDIGIKNGHKRDLPP